MINFILAFPKKREKKQIISAFYRDIYFSIFTKIVERDMKWNAQTLIKII